MSSKGNSGESGPVQDSTVPREEPTKRSHTLDPSEQEELGPEDVPPPAYSEQYGHINFSHGGLSAEAHMEDDGRVGISIGEEASLASSLLLPTLKKQLQKAQVSSGQPLPPGYLPPSLGGTAGEGSPPPPMNLVIHVVGSRGDVQPFIALGKVLKETYGHRVRLATHGVFKDFVTEHGLEFFQIGGDPSELMAFMVKNPGLMPGPDAIKSGDIRKRRKGISEILQGCWRSCFEAGDGTEVPVSAGGPPEPFDDTHKPFIADAIIANPPSFAHVHCAEKLGIPVHIMFTMPWSPTQAFPHPLANILKSGSDVSLANFLSYIVVELMTWQGLGDVINRFREKHLHLEPLGMMWGPALSARLRVPHTYCWSPALIPKPRDWKEYITVSGFFFLSLGSNYQPEPDLAAFLEAGPPPVYIGFGSIVVDDPNEMTNLIFEAVKLSGQRALVSKGWGGFGSDDLQVPDNIFMLGNVPHDWLFKHVSCVVHHGGAGTTSAGIALGKPTVIVPFFGDQPFWGAMVAKAGAGPEPIHSKSLTAENLAEAIKSAVQDSTKERAKELADSIAHEKGTDLGAKSFHDQLDVDSMRCSIAPSRIAVWQVKRSNIRLSALAAAVLGQDGKVDVKDLEPFRAKEHDVENTPSEPILGAAGALISTVTNMTMGAIDIPTNLFQKPTKTNKGAADDANPPKESTPETADASTASTKTRSDQASSITSADTNTTESSTATQTAAKSGSGTGKGKQPASERPDLESALDAGRGVGRIVDAGFRSPMDFTMALAKGYRNVPKLYGDDTVRPIDRVTGIESGLRVAGKEFGYGMYDGITGLVTQPMEGAKKGGFSGMLKGFGKGIGGVMFKPPAAFWSIPGYTFQGIYKELRKRSGATVQNYIIAARTSQGLAELAAASEAEQRDILKRWDGIQADLEKQQRAWYRDMFKGAPKGDSTREAQALAQGESGGAAGTDATKSGPQQTHSSDQAGQGALPKLDKEYEEAVRQSVNATSRGDPAEDAQVENAIRASLAELQREKDLGVEDPEMAKAIRESIAAGQGNQASAPGDSKASGTQPAKPSGDDADVDTDDDENVKKAIEASKQTGHQAKADEDPELAKALEESRREHEEGSRKTQAEEDAVVEYMKKQSLAEGRG